MGDFAVFSCPSLKNGEFHIRNFCPAPNLGESLYSNTRCPGFRALHGMELEPQSPIFLHQIIERAKIFRPSLLIGARLSTKKCTLLPISYKRCQWCLVRALEMLYCIYIYIFSSNLYAYL